jgi:hypothetical protein
MVPKVHKFHSTDLTQFLLFPTTRRRNTVIGYSIEQCWVADSRSTGQKIRNYYGIWWLITIICRKDVKINLLKCCALQSCRSLIATLEKYIAYIFKVQE